MAEKHKHRLQPCPSYDIEGMEAWLEDMAAEGLLLVRDGFMLGFGEFAVQKPNHKVRYRLVARQKNGGLFNDRTVPDDEALELMEEFGWEFVTHRGDFYIYRTTRADAREMDTDPAVQALAMNAVKKRQRANIISVFIWMVVYPLLVTRVNLVRTALAVGTPLVLLTLTVLIWSIVEDLREFVHIRRLYKKLKNGEPLERRKNWRRSAVRFQILRVVRWTASAVCLILILVVPLSLIDDKLPTGDFAGSPPFATLSDYGIAYSTEDYDWSNEYRAWSDLISPITYEWDELGTLTLADGSTVTVSYDVEYHELRTSWLAQLLAREIKFFDRWENRAGDPLDLPDLGADYSAAYRCRDMYETVVLVYDNVVVRAQFYKLQSSDGDISLETWTKTLASSLN